MSKNWVNDIHAMHEKFQFHEWMDEKHKEGDSELLKEYLKFRISFLEEELRETKEAFENGDAEEVVDGLIDLCVVAIGTLDLYDTDTYKAWDVVHEANMSKERGMKASRPNKFGAPDLIKPEGWQGPSHENNHGYLTKTFKKG